MAKTSNQNFLFRILLAGFVFLLLFHLWLAGTFINVFSESSIPGLYPDDYMLGLGWTEYYVVYFILRISILVALLVMIWKWRQGSMKAYRLILIAFSIGSLFSLMEELIYLWVSYNPNDTTLIELSKFTRLFPLLVFNNPVFNVVLNFALLGIVLKNKPIQKSSGKPGYSIPDVLDQPH